MTSPPGRTQRLALLFGGLLVSCIALAARTTDASRPRRQDLGIDIGNGGGISVGIGGDGVGIGGGGAGQHRMGYSPPHPSSEPRPCDFENQRLYRAYLVIQKFRKTVTCDPMGVASSWTGTDLCKTYKGFFCARPPNITDRTIASVDFNGYRLQADSLQSFVDSLPDLAIFHANSNDFGGAVPRLRGLQYFYELDLSNNRLAPSTFPTDILGLTNATFIDLRFNSFYGELPAGVFSSFPQVEAIFLNNNKFSGNLPENLGESPVNYLSLANNHFTGQIPTSIVRAADTLQELLLLNNNLGGCLPYELGLLANATLIDAGTNQFTGTIPLSYACLHKVEQLNLADNLLYGHVHDSLCRLAYGRLTNLTLSGNYLTSLGLCCWDLIKQGRLNVDGNCIPWAPNQRSPEECFWFFLRTDTLTCPLSTHVPCLHGDYGDGAGSTEVADAAEEHKYRTYSSLRP